MVKTMDAMLSELYEFNSQIELRPSIKKGTQQQIIARVLSTKPYFTRDGSQTGQTLGLKIVFLFVD